MFLEFFFFELKIRFKSVATYCYFLLWIVIAFSTVAAEGFGPAGIGKITLNGPYVTELVDVTITFLWRYHHRGHFRHIHPARLPAEYLPNHLHQADHQVRLSWRALGQGRW